VKEKLKLKKIQEIQLENCQKYDLVISMGALHNLRLNEIKFALNIIENIAKKKYIMVESYRNEQELFNLQCWALTCETFLSDKDWLFIFKEYKYTGDYEFIYFE
jgi:hypothetical protein